MSPLPYRYADMSVGRYIPILTIVQQKAVPARIEFDPKFIGVNCETAACRLRDAAHSLINGLTTHPSIDPTLLAERFRHYRVSHDGTKVFVIPKTEKKQSTSPPLVDIVSQQSDDVLARVKSNDGSALRAFALLLGRQHLKGKVEIVGELNRDLEHDLTTHDDIVIVAPTDDPNLHIMF